MERLTTKALTAFGGVLLTLCLSCAVNKPEDAKNATKIGGLDAALQIPSSGSSAFRSEVHPAYWSAWTSDGGTPIQADSAFLTRGLRCSGRYCDDVSLLFAESGYQQTNSWWTSSFSEESPNEKICENNGFVTGLSCSGDYCDNVQLRCSQLNNNNVRKNCYWSGNVSEESGGKFIAPQSSYAAGARCSGRYCDNMQLYMCQADAGDVSFDLNALAQKFAPRLRFDQKFGEDSGDQSKCFPSDAGTYYDGRQSGASPQSLCNQNYSTIANNQVPIYYTAASVGTNTVVIRYFFFYAWQSTCFVTAGSHAADWESMVALVVNGQLARVSYHQHSGWYTKEPGQFEVVGGTHPIGYVGKNAHGTFHDSGGSGGCLYFEDFRNPGGNDYHMDTWNNLTEVKRGAGQPAWMNCQGSGCFDGIGHPLERGELSERTGCGSDGCDKSSMGSNIPFITDPSGSDGFGIQAKHSGRVLDVPGASGDNGVNLWQWNDQNGDNQRWTLQSTGDGYFQFGVRHSGKCMDIKGGSTANGTNAIQFSCGGGNNQRFRLLGYGDGYFAIQAKHSNQCLDIAGAATGDGGLLIQWPCAWTDNEKFRFKP